VPEVFRDELDKTLVIASETLEKNFVHDIDLELSRR
jgi:hypothetical protein